MLNIWDIRSVILRLLISKDIKHFAYCSIAFYVSMICILYFRVSAGLSIVFFIYLLTAGILRDVINLMLILFWRNSDKQHRGGAGDQHL